MAPVPLVPLVHTATLSGRETWFSVPVRPHWTRLRRTLLEKISANRLNEH